ncbi:MAG: hypothetical protein KF883_09600 [Thermomicrobiales bacterium]|nr:hypothetical protein [Thermomicrobiales bacterium]
MRFLCIVYGCDGPGGDPQPTPAGIYQKVLENHRDLARSGHLIASSPLQPATTAITVQVREEGHTVTDGPFAETKEQVGGFYLIEAEDMDQAVQLTLTMPPATIGAIEIRPLAELPSLE